MFLQKFSALSNEKHYLHGDLPRDVLHAELCSLRKGHCWLCPPLPVPCPCWSNAEGALLSWDVLVLSPGPGCSQTSPQLQQNPFSPPVPFPGISHDLFMATAVVILPLLRRTGPSPAPLPVPSLSTFCVGHCAVACCSFSWGKDPASLIQ